MRAKITFLLFPLFGLSFLLSAQVKTNLNNDQLISTKGHFNKGYKEQIDFEISAKNVKELVENEKKQFRDEKLFRFAEPVSIDLDIANHISWVDDKVLAYGKFTIRVNKALSTSINLDKFYLPKGTEMYVYNEKGNMITGPVTENENNPNKIWGSWVYQGEYLTVELKTPVATRGLLLLHSNNIAYGYKEVYETQVGGFGQSASCNINVICPLGAGWESERNSVGLILSDNGSSWGSGALVMNTCNTNRPFFLTANHVLNPPGLPQQNVAAWRFTFQAWSTTCLHPGTNSNGVTYNGSTLRANSAATDFCLVELNNTHPANSGIHYAGWNRNINGITQSTIIHHPKCDVMKITRDNQPPVFSTFLGANCWQLVVDQGTTEGGSSGAPYFDQNHRIIAQHYGINDANLPVCQQVNKFGGRFDLSWTGGGTNATRLSTWLDPSNSGAVTTNTTNVSTLFAGPNNISINGNEIICSNNTDNYSVNNLPPGTTVTWSASPAGNVQFSCTTCPQTDVTVTGNQSVTITATVTGNCLNGSVSKTLIVANIREYADVQCVNPYNPCFQLNQLYTFYISNPQQGVHYKWGLESPSTGLVMDPNQTDNTYGYFSFSEYGGNRVVAIPYSVCSGDGEYDDYGVYISPYGCNGYRVQTNVELFPNPARDQVTVKLKQLNAKQTTGQLKDIREVRIVDKVGSVKRIMKYPPNTNVVSLNIGNLPLDVYYIEITDGRSNTRLPLSVIK